MKSITRTILAGCAAAALSAGAAQAMTVTIQSSFNANDFTMKFFTDTWLPKLAKETDGRVKMKLLPNGSVVPGNQTLDATAMGVIDGDFTSTSYFAGKEPAFALLGDLISGYDTPEQMQDFCKDDQGTKLLQEAIDKVEGAGKVKAVACGPYGKEALPARVAIPDFAAMKGKKIRAPQGLESAIFAAAGAVPVSIPFSEVFSALQKGTVDAADASVYINNAEIGIHAVAPYSLYPGISSMPSMQLTISDAKWKKISAADQKTIRSWWYDAMAALSKDVAKQSADRAKKDAADGKVHLIDWSDESRAELRKVARGQWEVFAKKSALAQKVLDADLAYMKTLGIAPK
ncbi:TRAP transporter substrate-binding protein DctP [Acidimangrovimonas sediminis]|uniref:TRAP transporter substrate-binding protein DctP n=1 Tax=Acidimangrovimonas sediminis TaxID=2056283 RepID=UPI000C8046F5|nr:TRAP transporter substrate-binding protein DctP [Acidimangrovimonas sediminis]